MRRIVFVLVLATACAKNGDPAPAPAAAGDTVDALAHDLWEQGLKDEPTSATFLGDRRYDAELPDLSAPAEAARRERTRAYMARWKALDAKALAGEELITWRVIGTSLEDELREEICDNQLWDVDQLEGWQVSLTELGTYQRVDSKKAAADYETRLARLPQLFDQHIDNLRAGVAAGKTAPKSVVERVLSQLDGMVALAPEASPFLTAVDQATGLGEGEPARTRAEVVALQKTAVTPAWARYRDFLKTEYLPKARAEVGVSHNPDGDSCYAARVRHHTSTDRTPNEIHELGISEMERLHGLMDEIAKSQGFKDRRAYADALRADKSQYLPTREALLEHNRKIVARVWAALPRAFGKLPKVPPEVRAIETFRENESPVAYYYEAADDGSRPAYYYVNTGKPETRPLYNMEALAFHEGVPGHHLQIALAQGLHGIPDLRRYHSVSAFVEGWGLYSELLGDELGLYSSPATRFGMLSYQAWRAGRLVVDTGMHALGWSRAQAIAYMKDNVTSLPEQEVVNEIDRYITWPGQALAYMIGRMEIQRLRKEAEAALGADFSVSWFHDRLLEHGAVPLAVMGEVMRADIEAKKGKPAPTASR